MTNRLNVLVLLSFQVTSSLHLSGIQDTWELMSGRTIIKSESSMLRGSTCGSPCAFPTHPKVMLMDRQIRGSVSCHLSTGFYNNFLRD
jgi:hypothetical protein